MKERKMREQSKMERHILIEKEKQRSLAEMMHQHKKVQIEKKLMAMEEKRKAFNQANHYANRVVKDLLVEQKGPRIAPYQMMKQVEDDIHLTEFLKKKRVGDQYLKESYHDVRRSSAHKSLSHGSSDHQGQHEYS